MGESYAQTFYSRVYEVMSNVVWAMQSRLIHSLDKMLNVESLVAMKSASWSNDEVCAAFTVYLTILERAYDWTRDGTRSTSEMLENQKLVIQVLNKPPLRQKLQSILQLEFYGQQEDAIPPATVAQPSLSMDRAISGEAQLSHQNKVDLPRASQDIVNLASQNCLKSLTFAL